MSVDLGFLAERPIAHRGLHDASRAVPENSLAAAAAAIEAGFAIECDVHRSHDGVPMVFHDHDLKRLTGADGMLSGHIAAELSRLPLLGSDERVPTLAALLDLVDGRVPLVVELKGLDEASDRGVADALRPLLAAYDGPIALMSFDPWLVDQALLFTDRLPVGLTAEGLREETLAEHRAVFDRGCSFVSYNVHHLPNAFVRHVREDRGLPVISWTVRTPGDVARSAAHADQMTFEGFMPQGPAGLRGPLP